MTQKIGFIGAGNMAQAMIAGFIRAGVPAKNIWVSNPSTDKLTQLTQQYPSINTHTDNCIVQAHVNILILAVKPNRIFDVLKELKAQALTQPPLTLSLAAGVPLARLQTVFNTNHMVRVMPNTPVAIGAGVLAVYADKTLHQDAKTQLQSCLEPLGDMQWLEDEHLLDVITVTAGSGPAYFFYFFDTLIESACQLGLSYQQARALVLQTALGSAMLAQQSAQALPERIAQVASKGGTTAQALAVFERDQIKQTITDALRAAHKRAHEISQEL